MLRHVKFLMIFKRKVEYYVPLYITAEDSNIQLMFSLCGYIPEVFPNNGSCSRTCIYNKQLKSLVTGKQNIRTLFDLDDVENNEVTLILRDELKCKNDIHYTITVRMVESLKLFKKPLLTVEGCDIIVVMMKPDYEPPCTNSVESKDFINLNPLKGKNILIPWEAKEFNIAICGTNKNCGPGTTACLKENNTIRKLGATSLQKVKFDQEKNELKIVSSYKEKGAKSLMEIILKCRWEVETFSNAKFINQSNQGRKYKFEVDSSYGCVKMPPNCLIEDRDNNLIYDLRDLTRESGTKVKSNSTNKKLLMHICGDLKGIGNRENECEKQHSQICEIDGNVYINKGSIPTYEITNQQYIKIFLRNGQKCGENSYSTEIDIKCSFYEKEPILIESENCSTKILWETPKGCPKFQSEEYGCAIKTHLGVINIADIYNEIDTIHSFPNSDKFIFNICGKLHKTCSSENEVSACYISNGIEHIIGWNNPKFSYTNGRLQLKYSGVKCKNAKKYWSFTINLYCSFAKLPKKNKIYKRDSCTFETDIYSLSACLSTSTEDCEIENNGVKYNLNPLKANESNYEIQDKNDTNLIFFMNICRSLINQNGLIAGNSMIYLLDKSIPHIWYRYTSLGKIARPTVASNGKLVINSILGSTCKLGTDYSSVIHFECTETNGVPELLKKKDCQFEFLWPTPYACPEKYGGSCLLEGGTVVPDDEVKFEIHGNVYKFSLCSEFYVICKIASCEKNQLTRNQLLRNSREYVEVKLKNSTACSKDSLRVNIDLQCDHSKTHSEISILAISRDSCHVDLLMKSLFICRNGSHLVERKADEITRKLKSELHNNPATLTNISEIEVEKIHPKKETYLAKDYLNSKQMKYLQSQQNEGHGVFTSDNNMLERTAGLEYQKYNTVKIGTKTFNLKNIQAFNVTGKNTYIINFNGVSSNCPGRICRNLTDILSFIENYPEVFTFEYQVVLNFTAKGKCLTNDTSTKTPRTEDLKIKIGLECSKSSSMTLSDETNCFIGFTYYSPQICDFIKSSNGFSVFTLFVGLIFLLLSLFLGYLFYRKKRVSSSYNDIRNTEINYHNHSKLL
ncbi:hypothetical protein WA026_002569 [Henosepilachna vigintioctopunctata]|uniref:MRH domain-containing protein n=1 Tax=Henosepilachna vigintioctopunctata TaxID=420089 RepID=A0AAW1TZU1_9CUCU